MLKQKNSLRWVIFFSVLFVYLIMSSQRTAPGLITDQLMVDFQISATMIGIVTSMQYFVYTSLQIPMGILADRYGANFFLIVGAFITGIGTILYSVASHEFILIFSRTLTGIGDATIWVNVVLVLSKWFTKKEFTRLIGFAAMTGSLGFLLATVPFAYFVQLFGWRLTFFSSGILLCLCALLLFFVLVVKPKDKFFVKNETVSENVFTLLRHIFFNRQAWALFCCHFGIVGTFIGFISSWSILYGMDLYGMSRGDASKLMMLSLIGALIGAPIISYISSRIGKIRLPYMLVHFLFLLCWIVFIFFRAEPPLHLLYVLFFIIGFLYGGNALTFATVRQTFPVNEAGLASGFANTGGFLSAVLLPTFFGKVLDHFQATSSYLIEGYYYGFFIPVVFSFVGFVGVMMLREKYIHLERSSAREN